MGSYVLGAFVSCHYPKQRGSTLFHFNARSWHLLRHPVQKQSQKSSMHLLSLVLLSVIASGCSSIPFFGKDDEDADIEAIETTEERVYSQAQRALRSSNFSVAIEQLELLEARFPFGRFAEQAQLELIYAHYLTQDMESARANADRFIRLHPTHPNVDYAFYLKGLSAYKFEDGLLDRLFSAQPASRDMAPLRESYSELAVLLNEFPNSQYASDARQRMLQLRELLARSEIFAADYYLRRGAFVAAANRGVYVIDNYPDTVARADALAVMVEAYYKLGRTEEANRSLRVLALNHPDYPEFDANGNLVLEERIRNRDRSWTNIMTMGLLDRPDIPPPITIEYPDNAAEPKLGDEPSQSNEDRSAEKKKGSIFRFLPFID